MIVVAVAVEVMNIIPQPVAMGVAVEVVVVVAAMVVVVVGAVVVSAVSGSSCSTRSAGGHSSRASWGQTLATAPHYQFSETASSSHCHADLRGSVPRSNESSATTHIVEIDAIMLPFYTLLKRLSPRMDRCTTCSDRRKR